MAGIGFELRKLLRKETLFGDIQAMLYSVTVFSGPWLFTCFCLAFLGVYFANVLDTYQQLMFRATVVYCYAFSMVFTGPVQMVTTRFLADKYFVGDAKANTPAFITSLALTLPIQAITAMWFLSMVNETLGYKILALLLYLVISAIWLTMVPLSAAKDYNSIIAAFFIGCGLSLVAATSLGYRLGLNGLLAGFLVGQLVILFALIMRLLVEFELTNAFNKELIFYFKDKWTLAVTGFFLNLGIWVDKFIFWYSKEAMEINAPLYSYPLYETATFLAYVAIVPAMGYFLIKVEVEFYDRYRNFFEMILHRQPLDTIRGVKLKMATTLREGTRTILLVQGLVTGAALYLSPHILQLLNLPGLYLGVVRISMIGALLLGLFLLDVLILFYFDLQKEVLAASVFFCVANAVCTHLSIRLGFPFYGYGFTVASLASLILVAVLLEWGLRNFEYHTFTKLPVS